MNICLYRNGAPAGSIDLPEAVFAACLTLDRWLAEQSGDCTVYGLGHVARRDARIAELEKQAAIDKTLLALADARINRELRDDFAGRAMQAAATNPAGAEGFTFEERAAWSYQQADAMLKAKGGA